SILLWRQTSHRNILSIFVCRSSPCHIPLSMQLRSVTKKEPVVASPPRPWTAPQWSLVAELHSPCPKEMQPPNFGYKAAGPPSGGVLHFDAPHSGQQRRCDLI